jgi:hypothetical protein
MLARRRRWQRLSPDRTEPSRSRTGSASQNSSNVFVLLDRWGP